MTNTATTESKVPVVYYFLNLNRRYVSISIYKGDFVFIYTIIYIRNRNGWTT